MMYRPHIQGQSDQQEAMSFESPQWIDQYYSDVFSTSAKRKQPTCNRKQTGKVITKLLAKLGESGRKAWHPGSSFFKGVTWNMRGGLVPKSSLEDTLNARVETKTVEQLIKNRLRRIFKKRTPRRPLLGPWRLS